MEFRVYQLNQDYSQTSIKMTFAPIDMTDSVTKRELKELLQKHPLRERQEVYYIICRKLSGIQMFWANAPIAPLAQFDPYLRNSITRETIKREKRIADKYQLTPRQLTLIWNEGQRDSLASGRQVYTLHDVHFIPLPDK